MAIKPGTNDLYIVTNDANSGEGATIYHARVFAKALPLYSRPEELMLEDFLHVSITYRDLERSVRFYETLGLKVIKRVGEVNEVGIAKGFRTCRRNPPG